MPCSWLVLVFVLGHDRIASPSHEHDHVLLLCFSGKAPIGYI